MGKNTKIIPGTEAFEAIKGKTIASVEVSGNSVLIMFDDDKFINIEADCNESHCIGHGPGEYCYCTLGGRISFSNSYFRKEK